MRFILNGRSTAFLTSVLVTLGWPLCAQQYKLSITGPTRVQAGEGFHAPVHVTVKDDRDAPVPGIVVTAFVSSGGGVLKNYTATSGANGVASFGDLNYSGPPGSKVIAFASGATTASSPLEVTLGEVRNVQLLQRASPRFISDSAFPVKPIVRAVDGSGNPIPGVDVSAVLTGKTGTGAPMRASKASGGNTTTRTDPSGQLLGTILVRTDADGKAEFKDLSIRGSGGIYQLQFTVPGSSPVVSGEAQELTYDPDAESNKSFVVISAIKSVAGQIPKDEFFDARFRFRLGSRLFFLGNFDVALSAKGTDTVTSKQEGLTEAGGSLNWGLRPTLKATTEERLRTLFGGIGFRVFNTVPSVGAHIGALEHSGSPFNGSAMVVGLFHSLNSQSDTLSVVPGDTTTTKNEFASARWSFGADFFLRSSTIAFFKVLNLRAGVLLPLKPGRKLQSRITIAIPVGTIDVF